MSSEEQGTSKVDDHYKQVSQTYNSHCFYRDRGFNEFIFNNVLNLIPRNAKTLCDIGSGTGQFAYLLSNRLNSINSSNNNNEDNTKENNNNNYCKIYCVEPSEKMLLQTPKSSSLIPIQNSANNFFELDTVLNNVNTLNLSFNNQLNTIKFDTIYFKESIHHIIETSKLSSLFLNIYNKLNENGIIIIITRPHNLSSNYPFSNVMRYYWQQYVPNPIIYRILLSKYFGIQNCQIIETQYPFKVLANDWLLMMKHRFWSMLSKLSENEINDGCNEIIKKHSINDINKDYFEFDDTITFVVARKKTKNNNKLYYDYGNKNNNNNKPINYQYGQARIDTAAPALANDYQYSKL